MPTLEYSTMRFGQYKPSTDPDFVVADPPRAVLFQRGKRATSISASCNVSGSICFVRAGSSGQGSRFVRIFRLVPPEPFSNGVVVFGLSGSALARLQHDDALVEAVDVLLKAGTRLSLQKNKLVVSVGNSNARKSNDAFSFYVGSAALRLEMVIGANANDAAGIDLLALPYVMYSFASALVFGTCFGLLESSLTPLTIMKCSLGLGLVLAGAALRFAIPMHLRKHPLGGAVVFKVVASALAGSIFLGSSLAMVGNTYLGGKLLQAQRVRVVGTIVVTREKHTHCWLYLDHPSSTLVPGMSFGRLPLTCGEARNHNDPTARTYEIELNPGLLGAPFVQSIGAVDSAQAD